MGPGQGQHVLCLHRIPHRDWSRWRGAWGSGEWEWTVPQRGSCGSSGRISHPSLIGPERKEMWIMQWDVILEGWSMGHWRGSGYGKGLGWEDPPCCSLFCLPWALLPWWQHLRMEESKALGVGAILLDFHIFGGDIKAKTAVVCPRLLSLSTPLS